MQIEDIAITFVPSLGVKGVVHLLETFGSAERVFAASADELVQRAQLRRDVAENLRSPLPFAAAEREIAYCARHGIKMTASTDPEYPRMLRETNDYPHVLYVLGSVEALSMRTITFVGTRRITPYGERACNMLIEGLAGRVPDLCIVSGLAYGVDAAAHRAAIARGVPTVAVVANPLPSVTPVPHTDLARDIVAHGGAIVSELPSSTKQNGSLFISRNRIMAALGHGTVVVESAAGGGSLATAKFADGYDRSVMAVPGRITDTCSQGTNMLIRNRKAQAVLSADDIAAELMWELELPRATREERDAAVASALLPVERRLLECFGSGDTATASELADRSGMGIGELSAHMMSLELSGAVRMLPGNVYEKLITLE